jgi:hypothetical protein
MYAVKNIANVGGVLTDVKTAIATPTTTSSGSMYRIAEAKE